MSVADSIELIEYVKKSVQCDALPKEIGQFIRAKYSGQIDIEAPSFFNDDCWQLTSQGWVGQIPLAPGLHLRLHPKTSLRNLFGMLEYAYRLKSFAFLYGLAPAQSVQEFYSQLANVLARRVLDRSRKGLYRTYRTEDDQLPYVRGRVEMAQLASKPWELHLKCQFQDHTADVDDNRILAWTLWRILRTGLCQETTLHTVRQAYRTITSVVELMPYSSSDCVGRLYQRLNQDYHPLHALT